MAERNLQTANDTLRLTRERKQHGVRMVIEDTQAQQAVTRSWSDFIIAVADSDKAQYGLNRAVGAMR